MKTKLLILFLVLLVPNGKLFLQELPDSCLKLVYPNDYDQGGMYFNPDSVMIDSCENSPTYGKLFSKKGYEFAMQVYVFGNEILPKFLPVTWQDISSSFTQIKEGFHNLELEYGTYTIQRTDYHPTDSAFLSNPVYVIEFQEYFNFDSVANSIDQIDSTFKAELQYYPAYIMHGNVDDNTKNAIQIFPNPAGDYIEINFERCPTSPRYRTSDKIEIYNVLGLCVKTMPIHPMTESHRMNIEDLPQGVYFITIIQQNQIFYHKSFVKEN